MFLELAGQTFLFSKLRKSDYQYFLQHRNQIISEELNYLNQKLDEDKIIYVCKDYYSKQVIASIEWSRVDNEVLNVFDHICVDTKYLFLEKFFINKKFRGSDLFSLLLFFSTNDLKKKFSKNLKYCALSKKKFFKLYQKFGVKKCNIKQIDGRPGEYITFVGSILETNKIVKKQLLNKGIKMNNNIFELLDQRIEEEWTKIHSGKFWSHIKKHGIDKELYTLVMTQIFHYTAHNTQNQALVSVNLNSQRAGMLKYALHHALEEAGHDLMVIKDLEYLNVYEDDIRKQTPLSETEALISFLYWTALKKDPVARLGYSYWAESCYTYISDLITISKESLNLTDSQMTFFVNHAQIDIRHFEEVKDTLKKFCTTDEIAQQVLHTAVSTLKLTGNMLDACYDHYMVDKS